MARTAVPDSATSQFFINLKDNANLDREYEFGDGFGYAVFAKVVRGQETVDKIARVETRSVRVGFQRYDDVPIEPVVIEKVELIDPNAPAPDAPQSAAPSSETPAGEGQATPKPANTEDAQ